MLEVLADLVSAEHPLEDRELDVGREPVEHGLGHPLPLGPWDLGDGLAQLLDIRRIVGGDPIHVPLDLARQFDEGPQLLQVRRESIPLVARSR